MATCESHSQSRMPEQDWKPATTKFISSFVKFLHILCNGHMEFTENIELVGHINVKVDHKYKFDYIVDEQVSKEGENTNTTFISNSYHSCPPLEQARKSSSLAEQDQEDVIFSELYHSINERPNQSKAGQECLASSHSFHAEDSLASRMEACVNYSVTAGPSDKQEESHGNQMVVRLEGDYDSSDCMFLPASLGDYEPVLGVNGESFQTAGPSSSFEESQVDQVGHTSKCQQPNEQGGPSVKEALPLHGNGQDCKAVKHEGTKQLVKKTNPLTSCREYLDKYMNFYKKKNMNSSKQEMMAVFSDLALKYGVAITIKPARFTAQDISTTKSTLLSPMATVSSTRSHCIDALNQHKKFDSRVVHKEHSDKAFVLPRGTKTGKVADGTVDQLPDTPETQSLQTSSSQIITVAATDSRSILRDLPVSYSLGYQTVIQESDCDIKHSTSGNMILSHRFMPFSASEASSVIGTHTSHTIDVQETSSSDVSCSIQTSVQSSMERFNDSHSMMTSRGTKRSIVHDLSQPGASSSALLNSRSTKRSIMPDLSEPDTPSSALLNAIAVALAHENNSSSVPTSAEEYLRQQPVPKRHRGNYLVCLRKEDPDRYERYKCLSKEEQARERRRISETNQDADTIERRSLMNRVLYFRRVNKLPSGLRGKSNDEIRCMSTDDLKKLLPPTKSLKTMDPVAKEEWYRLGRSREWRRRKKLLDPEGFKRYNNERAKRYQENLRKNNPDKYKEMRAKGADRLRQYRFSQRIMKAIKEGREIKISDPASFSSRQRRVGGRKKDTFVEQEADEELLIEENIDKSFYVIPECATTHGEAATGREPSSGRTDQPLQPDILDLMYSY